MIYKFAEQQKQIEQLEAALRDSCRDDRAEIMGGCPLSHRLERLKAAARAVVDRHDEMRAVLPEHMQRSMDDSDIPMNQLRNVLNEDSDD